jgi:hypothetical protein
MNEVMSLDRRVTILSYLKQHYKDDKNVNEVIGKIQANTKVFDALCKAKTEYDTLVILRKWEHNDI